MNKYLEAMLCIWVTLAVLRLLADWWTVKWRYNKNKQLLDNFSKVTKDIEELKDYIIEEVEDVNETK
jgi:hypothetical protein